MNDYLCYGICYILCVVAVPCWFIVVYMHLQENVLIDYVYLFIYCLNMGGGILGAANVCL